MIIFDIRLGHFSVLAQRETVPARSLFSRPASGEIIIDLPAVSLTMTYYKAHPIVR